MDKLHKWINQWLSNRKQRVVINGVTSEWMPVTRSCPLGSVLWPVLFIIYINKFIGRFADDTKTGNVVVSDDRRNLLEDLCIISDCSVKWIIHVDINKCQILQVGSRNIKNDYEMRRGKIKCSLRQISWCHSCILTSSFPSSTISPLKSKQDDGFDLEKFFIQEKRCYTTFVQFFCQTSLNVCRAVLIFPTWGSVV